MSVGPTSAGARLGAVAAQAPEGRACREASAYGVHGRPEPIGGEVRDVLYRPIRRGRGYDDAVAVDRIPQVVRRVDPDVEDDGERWGRDGFRRDRPRPRPFGGS